MKKWMFKILVYVVFLLATVVPVVAQNTLGNLGLTSSTPAAAAYSLRKLSSSYSGPLVRILIGSNFYDVYPDATSGAFATTSLISAAQSTFNAAVASAGASALSSIVTAGTTNAKVAIWYDQSGYGINVRQAITSKQPSIITSGTINTYSGKPTMYFNASNTGGVYFQSATSFQSLNNTPYTLSAVCQTPSGGAGSHNTAIGTGITGAQNRSLNFGYTSTTGNVLKIGQGSNTSNFASIPQNNKLTLLTGIRNNTAGASAFLNGNASGSSQMSNAGSSPNYTTQYLATNSTTDSLSIGTGYTPGAYDWIGNISEVILFPGDLSAIRSTFESNQSAYYDVPLISSHPSTGTQTLCVNATATAITVTASATSSLSYQWYSNTTNSNITGGVSLGSTSGAQTSSYTPSTAAAGTLYYYCIVTNATSGAYNISNVSGAITVNATSTPTTANAGADQTGSSTCGLTTVTLAGNAPSNGTGAWSIVSGTGGTINTPSSRTSTFTGTAGATYTLRWTISNGSCTASTDDVVIKFNLNPGSFGNALNFDGSNDVVNVSTGSATVSGTYTFEVWAKPSTTTGMITFFGSRTNSVNSFDVKFKDGNIIHGDIGDGTNWLSTTADASLNYVAGQWYHIAYVVTPTGYTIYINGIQSASGTFSGTPLLFNSTTVTQFGNNGRSTAAEFFDGSLDEARIWNVARTQSQIQASMNTELMGNESGLVAYYNFNQGTAGGTNTGLTTLNDITSNGYNGTLNSFALTGSTSNWVTGNSFSIASITGTSSICSNATSQMSNATLGGVWSFPNSTYATVNSTGLVSSVAAETPTLSYTLTSGAGCASAATQVITVRSAFTSGAISTTGQTICSGGTPTVIGSSTASSGGDGTITYSWRSSASSYGSAISGATSATYTPPAGLTSTTSYRRYANDGTCTITPTVSTGTWTVTVNQPSTAAVLSGTATITLGNSTNLSVAITGGTSPYTVVYSNGTSKTTVNSYTSGSNISVSPTATTTYTLVSVTDANGCAGSGNSGSAVITVNASPTASVLSGTSTICSGSSTNLSVAITGGTSPYTVVYSNGTSNTTVSSYTSGANISVSPTATTTYTLVSVTDANGNAGTGNSGSAVISVTSPSVAGSISGGGVSVVSGSNSTTLTLSGYTGTIQWQSSTTSSSSGFSNIGSATSTTYTATNLTATTYYQAVVTNGVCSSATASSVTISMLASPSISYAGVSGSMQYVTNSAITPLSITNAGGAVTGVYKQITDFVGSNTGGSADGTGTSASFSQISQISFNQTRDTLYAADFGNQKIRKITLGGVVTTLAGNGSVGGTDSNTGTSASFNYPFGVASDVSGNLYVSEGYGNKIRKITPGGVVSTLVASGFNNAASLKMDASSNLFVGDYANNKVKKVNISTGAVTNFANSSTFNAPVGVAFDASGNLYVGNKGSAIISKVTPGEVTTTFAGSTSGFQDGTGTGAQFSDAMYHLQTGLDGNLYIGDYNNGAVRQITVPGGVVSTFIGKTPATTYVLDGAGNSTSTIGSPMGIDFDNQGYMYVSQVNGSKIQKVSLLGYSVSPALPTGLTLGTNGTISGTPTVTTASTTYTITGANAAGSSTTTVTFATGPLNTITRTSAAGTVAQTVCANTAITNITYSTTSATGATFSGLPSGVSGAWSSNVVTISGTPTVAGSYSYTITLTGGIGTVTATGTITVSETPVIASQSTATQTVCQNATAASFSVTATGTGTISYQWYSNTSASTSSATNLGSANGAQTATYTPQTTASGTKYYYCVVTIGSCTATSAFSGAVVVTPLSVAGSISGAGSICNGVAKTLTLSGNTGTIQWQVSTASSSSGFADISGATASTYIVPTTTAAGTYYYQAVVTNGVCNPATTSSVTVNVNALPVIVSQTTATQTICQYLTATTLSVSATGTSLTYQWYSNTSANNSGGTSISGATSSNYTPSTTAPGTLYYYCVVTNGSSCTATSAVSGAIIVNAVPVVAGVAQAGSFGNGLNFDGSNDYVAVSTNTNIPISNTSYTLEAYIKPTTHSSNGIVGWGNYESGSQVNALRLGGSNQVHNYWWGNDLVVTLSSPLTDGCWHHIAATFDGTTRKIYVDGVLKGSDNPGGGHNVPNANNMRIGTTNSSEYFNGSLDEVKVWNVARTQAQIQASMNMESAGTETGLVAYYNFNQGTAGVSNTGVTTLTDRTSNANNGTLTNFALTGSTSNWVAGANLTCGGSSTAGAVCVNSTIQLSNTTTGGTWSTSDANIATVDNTGLVTGIAAGSVTISYTVTNASNCSTTATSSVTVNALPVISSQSTAAQRVIQNGTASAFSVTATGTGLTYQWYSNTTASNTGGTSIASATSSSYTPLTTTVGTTYYYSIVTNSNRCIITSSVSGAVIIEQMYITSTGTLGALCNSTSAQTSSLVYTAAVNNPTAYSIDWNAAANTAGLTDQTSTSYSFVAGGGTIPSIPIAAGLAAGTYTGVLTITNANNLTNTTNVSITINPLPTITTVGTATAKCFSASAQTTSLVYTATTQSPTSYSIDWDATANTAGLADQGTTSYTFVAGGGTLSTIAITAGTPAGTYSGTMTITNANGCTKTQAVTVQIYALPVIVSQSTATQTICQYLTATTLSVSATGTSLTYQWYSNTSASNSGGTIIASATSSSYTPSTTVAGTKYYYCIVTNSNSCTATSAVSGAVIVNAVPVVAGVAQAGQFGNGLKFDGSNDYVISSVSGTALTSFTMESYIKFTTNETKGILQWANGLGHTNPFIYWKQSGLDLSIYMNNAYGITTTLSLDTWYHVALVYSSNVYTLYINGNSVATYNGGFLYQNSATSFYLGNGYHGYFGGIMDEVRIWNTARTQSQIQATMNTELAGTETNLMTYYNFNQGTASGTNTGVTTLTDRTSNAKNGTLTNFTLTGSTSNWVAGAQSTGGSSTAGAVCVNSTIQLSNTTTGGTWSTSDATIATVDNTGLVTGVAVGSVTISYTVTNASNCSTTATSSVTVNALPVISSQSTAAQRVIQNGTASAFSVTATGTGLTYQWYSNTTASNTGGTSIASATSSTYTPPTATLGTKYYYCIVTNASGCIATSAVSGAVVIEQMYITSTGTIGTVCYSSTAQTSSLVYTATANNPTSYSIDWNAAANTAGLADQTSTAYTFASGSGTIPDIAIAAGATAGTYSGTLTIRNANNITATLAVTITINPLPTITTTGIATAKCISTSTQTTSLVYSATTQTPISYSIDWNAAANTAGLADQTSTSYTFVAGGGTLSTMAITGGTPVGTYSGTMTITNANGCTNTQAVSVVINALPIVGIRNNTNTTVLTSTVTSISLTATGGSTYSWSNGTSVVSTTAAYRVTALGTYTVTVTNTNGCSSTASITITQTSTPPVTSITNNTGTTELNCTTSSISLTATGGGTYSWSNGTSVVGTSAGLTVSTPGTYTVTVTNGGSTSTSSITITQNVVTSATAVLTGSTTITSGKSANLQATISIGNAPYTVVISDGTSQFTTYSYYSGPNIVVTPTTTKTYTLVSVTGANGCAVTSISGSATVTINSGGTSKVWTGAAGDNLWSTGGNWSPAGTPVSNDFLTISSGTPQLDVYFTVNGSLTVNGTGTLTVNAGKSIDIGAEGVVDFGKRDITFKSSATGTAQLGKIEGSLSNADSVIVERYFPSGRRAYRFISASVTTPSSIRYNWMENATPVFTYTTIYTTLSQYNPKLGYGTHITGTGGNTNGFDRTALNTSTLYTLNTTTQAWDAVGSTSGTLAAGDAYRILIRGDRAINLNNNNTFANATTIRTKGAPKVGLHTVSSSLSTIADGWSLVGNPYQSLVDLRAVSTTNLTPYYSVWDPQRGTRGAYVSYHLGTGIKSNVASDINELVQPGQAFFVQTLNAGAATLTFEESNKAPLGTQTRVFRPIANYPVLNVALNYTDSLANGAPEMDAFAVVFDNNFSNGVDKEDGQKNYNQDDNMGISRDGKLLAMELRDMYNATTVIPMNMVNYVRQNYTLRMNWSNPIDAGYEAYIKDNYTGATQTISFSSNTDYVFTVNSSIAGSKATDRFSILFLPSSALPVSGLELNGTAEGKQVKLQFTALNERDMAGYEIEHSADGINFTKIGDQPAVNGIASARSYAFIHNKPVEGNNYYRVKGTSLNGQEQYSNVKFIRLGAGLPTVMVAPNPAGKDKVVLKVSQLLKGNYTVTVTDALGRIFSQKEMVYDGVSGVMELKFPSIAKSGSYYVKVNGEGVSFTEAFIIQ